MRKYSSWCVCPAKTKTSHLYLYNVISLCICLMKLHILGYPNGTKNRVTSLHCNTVWYESSLVTCCTVFFLTMQLIWSHLQIRCPFQPKSTDICLILHKNICCGYSFEVPRWGTSNEYPQHMLMQRNTKTSCGYPILSGAMMMYFSLYHVSWQLILWK